MSGDSTNQDLASHPSAPVSFDNGVACDLALVSALPGQKLPSQLSPNLELSDESRKGKCVSPPTATPRS